MFRLGLILDLHMLKTYNLKDSDKSQRSRKESYIKGNGAFTFDFHLVCHIELYCCFYFLTMSAKNTLSEKGRPLRTLRHSQSRARAVTHVELVKFFSLFQCTICGKNDSQKNKKIPHLLFEFSVAKSQIKFHFSKSHYKNRKNKITIKMIIGQKLKSWTKIEKLDKN